MTMMVVVTAAMKRVVIKGTVMAVACLFINSLYLNLAISYDSNGFISIQMWARGTFRPRMP